MKTLKTEDILWIIATMLFVLNVAFIQIHMLIDMSPR
jgi:hypothetical protein